MTLHIPLKRNSVHLASVSLSVLWETRLERDQFEYANDTIVLIKQVVMGTINALIIGCHVIDKEDCHVSDNKKTVRKPGRNINNI